MVPICGPNEFPPLMAQDRTEDCSYIVSDIHGALTNGSICRASEADRWCYANCTLRLSNNTLRQVAACIKQINTYGRYRDADTVTQGGIAVVDSGVSGMAFRRWHWQIQTLAGRYLFNSGSGRWAGDREYIGFVRLSSAENASPGWFGEIWNSLFNMYTARTAALVKECSRRDSLQQ